MSIISNLFLALFLTIAIELIVSFILGFRNKKEIIAIILINIITNPVLNYLLLINNYFNIFKANVFIVLFLEVLIVLAEWKLLVYIIEGKSYKLLKLSFMINFCSYIAGVLIFR